VPKRDPHDVLGVRPGASAATIKAAWRRLARAHHPDLTGDDPAASRVATRRMAEINDAYESLRRADVQRRAGLAGAAAAAASESGPPVGGATRRGGGPPRPRPSRPVTARLDTSDTFRPRNATTSPRASLPGQPPVRLDRLEREPLRASQPTGPLERARVRRFRPPPAPSLDAARDLELAFGKFRGHTLGEVAAFEPSYVDWLANTITRDPDLVAAARVIAEDLDRRGIVRRSHADRATRPGPTGRTA
jgi:curved DNA-binding protein CbpA